MIRFNRTSYLIWLLVLLPGLLHQVVAQHALPLQPHKLKLAQRLCREGLARHDSVLLAEGYYEYGKLHAATTDYHTAQQWFMKTLRILDRRGDSYELARVHVRFADLAMLLKNYTQAVFHAREALSIAKRCRSDRGLIRAYALLGYINDTDWSTEKGPKANSDSSLYYLHKVEYLAYRLNDPMEVAHVKGEIGNRMAGKDFARAIQYLTDALAIATRQNSPDRMWVMTSIANTYRINAQPDRALLYIKQAKQIADSLYPNVYYWQYMIQDQMNQYYRATGKWKKALIHTDTLRTWDKRDLTADRTGAITRLNVEFETEKKEMLLKAQQEEITLRLANERIQQRFLWAVSTLLLVSVGMSILFFRLYRQNKRIRFHNAELVREQNHRVKNNLQVVSSLLSLQASRLADDNAQQAVEESQLRVQAMAILHRRLYDGEQLASVFLPDYITELVDDVLVAFGYPGIQPVYDIDPITLAADDALPLGLMLNELTTNACKYAFPGHREPYFLVSCQQQATRIRLNVVDNGPGLDRPDLTSVSPRESVKKSTRSFGMRLIDLQASQLRGVYQFASIDGTKFTLEFNSRKVYAST